jgi:hypothetical protein
MSGETPRSLVDRAVLEHPAWRAKLARYGRLFSSKVLA